LSRRYPEISGKLVLQCCGLKDEFTLRNNGVPQKTRKLQDIILEENSAGRTGTLPDKRNEGRRGDRGVDKGSGIV
jgi:hypothetical protein